jgi:hypothetical protein
LWEWTTCEMKWCVLGMKPYANLFMYKQSDDVAPRFNRVLGCGATHNGFHNECSTVNGALVIVYCVCEAGEKEKGRALEPKLRSGVTKTARPAQGNSSYSSER